MDFFAFQGRREGDGYYFAFEESFVAALRIGIARVLEDARAVRAWPDEIVFLAAVEGDNAEVRLFPPDTVAGDCIADSHLSATTRMPALVLKLAAVYAVLFGRIRCALVDDERAVPALVELFIFVVEDVGVEIVEPRLPGLVLFE